jgi:AcrR family transcriptional regulator
MPPRARIPAEERRRRILEAVIPVFAEKGFHGATTRELAEAAGVSEALLYRHFPSKESLFRAIFDDHLETRLSDPEVEAALRTPPSTAKLVQLVVVLVGNIAGPPDRDFARLILRSLLHDGNFTRTVFHTFRDELLSLFAEALRAAARSGDLVEDVAEDVEAATGDVWFAHHLAAALKFFSLCDEPVVPYGVPRDELLPRAVRFALRGIGLREEALRRSLGSSGELRDDRSSARRSR